jgi:hypothetical protein
MSKWGGVIEKSSSPEPLANFNQTLHKLSLGEGYSSLFK